MNKHKKLTIVIGVIVLYMVTAAIFSRGKIYLIESEEPLQDIVVICSWASELETLHGGHSVMHKRGQVVESGRPYNCGSYWLAGLSLALRTSNIAKHPTHTFNYIGERDGVIVSKAVSKLKILEEQQAKFEAGAWDGHRNPGAEYARSLTGCGFPYQYFDYYSEVKKVDKEYFRQKYHESLLECKQRTYPIMVKYHSRSYPGERPTPEQSMEYLWNSEGWEKYQ